MFYMSCASQNGFYSELDVAMKNKKEVKVLSLVDELVNDRLLEFENIEEMYLIDCKLDSIPDEIAQLKELRVISIYNSELTWVSPKVFELGKLEKLELRSNKIKKLEFQSNKRLSFLDISYNDNLNLKNIELLENLETLNSRGNGVISLPEKIFLLKKLNTVDYSENEIELIPNEIVHANQLEYLYLDNNDIIGLPEELFSLINLKYLRIIKNNITKMDERFVEMKSLKMLSLSYNNIVLNNTEFHFEKLETLLLKGNKSISGNYFKSNASKFKVDVKD